MAISRIITEKLLFPGETDGQKQRHMRFFLLAVSIGLGFSVALGAILYTLNMQGRI
jgi:hypothetical protein